MCANNNSFNVCVCNFVKKTKRCFGVKVCDTHTVHKAMLTYTRRFLLCSFESHMISCCRDLSVNRCCAYTLPLTQCVISQPVFALTFDGQEIMLQYVVSAAIVCHRMVCMILYTAGYTLLIAADLIWWCMAGECDLGYK